ncbi:unnamed protein product [Urochloa humidicola]
MLWRDWVPACGVPWAPCKSSLLDALMGRFAANAFQSGTIFFNDRKANLSLGARDRHPACCNFFSTITRKITRRLCPTRAVTDSLVQIVETAGTCVIDGVKHGAS